MGSDSEPLVKRMTAVSDDGAFSSERHDTRNRACTAAASLVHQGDRSAHRLQPHQAVVQVGQVHTLHLQAAHQDLGGQHTLHADQVQAVEDIARALGQLTITVNGGWRRKTARWLTSNRR